ARRYASAADLADDLRRFLDGRPVRARRAGAAERAWRWCRRRPAVAGLLAAIVLLTAVSFAVVWSQMRAAQENERRANQPARDYAEQRDKPAAARGELGDTLYVAHLNLIAAAAEAENWSRVRELLALHVPRPGERDRRGFEWHYWD